MKNGLGPIKSEKLVALGKSVAEAAVSENLDNYAALFRKAQRRVERKHFRDRMVLLHHEKERKKMQREIGQDPYLDTPD